MDNRKDEDQYPDAGADEGLVVTDSNGQIVEVTDPLPRVTGYSKAELLTMELSALFWHPDADNSGRQVGAALSEIAGRSHVILECADGSQVTVEQRSYTVRLGTQTHVCTTVLVPSDGELAASATASEGPTMSEADALRRLQRTVMDGDSVEDITERLLALGREYLGAEAGALARIEDGTYEVKYASGPASVYEAGQSMPLGDTISAEFVTDGATERRSFVVAEGEGQHKFPSPNVCAAYIGAPVIVEGDVYGIIEFTGPETRENPFSQREREFVASVARWLGNEIVRERRNEQLERYETVLEAVDDPVYALDTDAQFTFVNDAAKRQFGYGEEILGEHVSIGMRDEDIQRITALRKALVGTDERAKTVQFELETAEGDHRLVENRFAVIGKRRFEGTAGVLRDVTDREQRRQQLESFQQAVEEAADGIAILEGDEYVYVDQTHADMYGFDSTDQLLGNTWRMLYDDDEVERLEAEAFSALGSEGYWRGKVTGSRPDGSTFPAELSLTIVDDGRLVCTVRDETERRERERELELKERAMDEANVGIQITDPTQEDNPLVYVNDGFERMTGYAREDVLGRNPRFLQGEDSDPEQVARLREAVNTEESVSLELRNERKDGTSYWSSLSVTPVTDESDAVRNYIGIQQDVTERKRQQRELQDRQRNLDLVLSNTDTSIGKLDPEDGTMAWEEMLGDNDLGSPETLGAFIQAVHPEDRERLQSDLETITGTGESLDGEYRLLNEDGETVWIAAQAVSVSTENGQKSGKVVAIATDITELKENQNRYQTLLEAAPDPVFVADAETGEIIEVNAAAEAVLGQARDDIVGEDQTEIHPQDDIQLYREVYQQCAGSSTVLSELPDGTQPELRGADGETVPVEINADTVQLPRGPVMYGVFRDVSRRRERERELELKERAMDEANLGITISDPDQEDNPLIYVNDGFVDQTGYSRDEAVGRNCRFLQADDRDQSALDELRDAIAAEEATTVELRNYRKDGEQFWNLLSVTPVYEEGAVTNFIGIQQDITDRRRRLEQLEAQRERLDLALSGTNTGIADWDLASNSVSCSG